MDEHLTDADRARLFNFVLRPFSPQNLRVPGSERRGLVNNGRALLKQSDVFDETCDMWADRSIEEMQRYDCHLNDGWRHGVSEELKWWWAWTMKLRREGTLGNWGALKDNPFPFEDLIEAFSDVAPLRCLNIGSGPRSTFGRRSSRSDIEVVDMDPLAAGYNALMQFLEAPGAGGIVFGAVEILDQLDIGRFNCIAATNCLDHAFDVPAGIEQMIGILADKGVIQMTHYENEAEAQGYTGFHQWNIEIRDERIRVWNRESSTLFDHEAHGLTLDYDIRTATKGTGAEHPMVKIRLKKGLA